MNQADIISLEKKLHSSILVILQEQEEKSLTEKEIFRMCMQLLKEWNVLLPEATQKTVYQNVAYALLGLGPLEVFLQDKEVSEIMVNGYDCIYIEKKGKLQKSELRFIDDKQLLQVINKIVGKVGRRIDESTPLVDARLEDGSRVNAIIPPLSLTGPTLTIRKFPESTFTMHDLEAKESLNTEMREFLEQCVEQRKNMVISGGTGAGKTSTLNALASLIPQNERIITIEDSAEIRIDHPHLITLESRPANIEGKGEIPIRILLKNSLRMRPDRIVVGEIRGGEAIDMLQAMNTGHDGSLTTVHANSPLESLYRIETMVLMGDVDIPLSAIRPQVTQGIDIVLQQTRLSDGSRKITRISEVQKTFGKGEYEMKDLFIYDEEKKQFLNLQK